MFGSSHNYDQCVMVIPSVQRQFRMSQWGCQPLCVRSITTWAFVCHRSICFCWSCLYNFFDQMLQNKHVLWYSKLLLFSIYMVYFEVAYIVIFPNKQIELSLLFRVFPTNSLARWLTSLSIIQKVFLNSFILFDI